MRRIGAADGLAAHDLWGSPKPHVPGPALFELADLVATHFGGSVAVEDLSTRVLAYSTVEGQLIDELRIAGILGRRVPEQGAGAEQYAVVLRSGGVVRFPADGDELARSAVAVRHEGRIVGTIWAIECGEPSSLALQVLAQVAERAGAALARADEDDDTARREGQRRLVADVFGESDRAALALVDEAGMLSVAVVAAAGGGAVPDRVREALVGRLRSACPQAAVAQRGERLYVLADGAEPGGLVELLERFLPMIDPGSRLRASVCAGGRSSAVVVRAEADVVLDAAIGSDRRVSTIADERAALLARHLGDELDRHPTLAHQGARALVDHDSRRRSQFALTLATWIEQGGSVGQTAAALHVHENTVRYRISRCRDLFGIDIDSFEERVVVWLQLRAHRDAPLDWRGE